MGTVEALELDRETRATVVLVVRRRRRGPMRLRADAVGSVDPWQRSLVVAPPQRRRPTVPVGRVAARTGRASAASGVFIARSARRTGSALAVAAATLTRGARRVGRAAAWATPRVLFVVGLAAWAYAVVVFTLVRVVVRLLVALTTGTARGGARIGPHLHGAK